MVDEYERSNPASVKSFVLTIRCLCHVWSKISSMSQFCLHFFQFYYKRTENKESYKLNHLFKFGSVQFNIADAEDDVSIRNLLRMKRFSFSWSPFESWLAREVFL